METTEKKNRIFNSRLMLLAAAIMAAACAEATDYYWIGGESGAWTTSANWSTTSSSGEAVESGYPTATTDTATIESDATITVSANEIISGITIASGKTLTLSSDSAMFYLNGDVTGDGTLRLSNVVIRNTNATTAATKSDYKKSVDITAPVDIPEGSTAAFQIYSASNDNGYYFYIKGKITGKGTLTGGTISSQNAYSGFHVSSDASEFEGTIAITSHSSQSRNNSSIAAASSSAKATYLIFSDGNGGVQNSSACPFRTANSDYVFGAATIDFLTTTAADNTFTIGALDTDSRLFGGQFGSRNTVTWVAPSATLTLETSALQILAVTGGGTVSLPNLAVTLPQRIKFTDDGGTLKLGWGLDPSAVLTQSTAAIVFDDEGRDATWATAIASSNTGGFVKKGAGTLELTATPAYTGTTKVLEGALIVPAGTTLAIDSESSYSTTLSDGRIQVLPKNGKFYWTGAAGDGKWLTTGNWSVDGETATSVPGKDSDAVIPGTTDAFTMNFTGTCEVSNLVVGADVTFVSSATVKTRNSSQGAPAYCDGNFLQFCGNVSGSGKITLKNCGLKPLNSNLTNAVDLVIAEGTTNAFCIGSIGGFVQEGDLTGGGYIMSWEAQGYGTRFYGNNTEFTGVLDVIISTGVDHRSKTYFNSYESSMPKATVNLRAYHSSAGDNYVIPSGSGTFGFGALNGRWQSGNNSPTIVVGAKNEDCSWHGHSRYDNQLNIDKVGTAKMVYESGSSPANKVTIEDGIADLEKLPKAIVMAGGTLQVVEEGDPSTLFSGSTAAIKFDSQGNDYTWASAINANNTVAEIEKSGSGTLTLSEAPAWSSTKVTVRAGALVMPASAAYTLGTNTMVTASEDGETNTFTPVSSVTFTIAEIANADAVVTADGVELTKGESGYTCAPWAKVVVTYTAKDGYFFPANSSSTLVYEFEAAAGEMVAADETAQALATIVCKVGDTPYASLASAIASIGNDGTAEIVMTADDTVADAITIAGWAQTGAETYAKVTVDLNGKTITYTGSGKLFNLGTHSTLTLEDTSDAKGGTITATGTTDAVIYSSDNGVIALSDITVTAGATVLYLDGTSTATFTSGTYLGTVAKSGTATILIEDGEYSHDWDTSFLASGKRWGYYTSTGHYYVTDATLEPGGSVTVTAGSADDAKGRFTVTITDEARELGQETGYFKTSTTQIDTWVFTVSVVLDPDVVDPTLAVGETVTTIAEGDDGALVLTPPNLKKGLYYALGTRSSLTGDVSIGDYTLYDGENAITFTLPDPGDGETVRYFSIEVKP